MAGGMSMVGLTALDWVAGAAGTGTMFVACGGVFGACVVALSFLPDAPQRRPTQKSA
jgi:hypothetical protein